MRRSDDLRDWIAGGLALIVTVTIAALAIIDTVGSKPVDIPSPLQDAFFAFVAFYLGGHAATNGAKQAGANIANAVTTAAYAQGAAAAVDGTPAPPPVIKVP